MVEKSNKKKLLLPIFIAGLMVLSVFGIFVGNIGNNTEKEEYKDLVFIKVNNGWMTRYDNKQIVLTYSPKELEYFIETKGIKEIKFVDLGGLSKGNKVYISIFPKDQTGNAFGNVFRSLKTLLNTNVLSSCYAEDEKCANVPIIKCEDAKEDVKVIMIKQTPSIEPSVSYSNNCLILNAKEVDIEKIADLFILRLIS